MRELIERLEALQAQWYANEIESEDFAYEVFEITTELKGKAHYDDIVASAADCPFDHPEK